MRSSEKMILFKNTYLDIISKVLNLAMPQGCHTEYNKNTLFHFFHSLSFKQRTQVATGRCSTKKSVLQLPKNTYERIQFFIVELLHRYFSQILNTDAAVSLQISYFEEHIFKYFSRTSSMADSQYHFNTINREQSKF